MDKLQKIIKFGIYLAFLLPLVFTSRTMYPWHFGKTILFQALVEILVALAIIYLFLPPLTKGGRGDLKSLDVGRLKFNLLDWLVIAFLAVQIISVVFGVNFIRSFWDGQQRAQGVFTWLHFGAFYFLLRYFFKGIGEWRKLTIWALIVAPLSCLVAWVGPYIPFLKGVVAGGARLSGIIGNPIFFAGYLIIPLFLGFGLFFALDKNDKWRWFALGAGAISLITLIFTQIRGAFLGLLAGAFLLLVFYLIFSKNKKAKIILSAGCLVFLILFFSLYIFNQKSDYLDKKSPLVSHLLDIKPSSTTASTRLMAWQIALQAWRDRPILGWGPENFQDAFDRHYNPQFLKYSFAETVWDKPHSYPLEVLSTMGAVGFAAYLVILTTVFVYLARIIKREEDKNRQLFFMMLAGAIAAYVIQSGFSFETSNSLLIWIFALALVGSWHESKREKEKTMFIAATWGIRLFLAVVLVLTPYAFYKNYTFYKASVLMGDARDAAGIGSVYQWQKNAARVLDYKVPFLWEQAIFLTKDLSDLDRISKLDRKTLEAVSPKLIGIFEKEINKNPGSYLFRFWLSQLYGFMGEYVDNKYYENSNKLLEEAARLSPGRQHVPLLLAKNYLLQKKVDEAINVLSKVVADNPDYGESHWFLGLALMQVGEENRGVEELEKGMGFGASFKGNILYLIDIYAKRKEYAKIISLYERLIEMEPRNASYYASLAATYAALGDKDNVIININKAVELNPSLAEEAKVFLERNGIK